MINELQIREMGLLSDYQNLIQGIKLDKGT